MIGGLLFLAALAIPLVVIGGPAECWRTELPPAQCGCPEHRGGTVSGVDDFETVGQVLVAQYAGPCAGCERGIRPGDEIARVADEAGVYVHAGGGCPR